jgi:MSHA pilin protein MshD
MKGMSLIELILAMVIISTALLGTLMSMSTVSLYAYNTLAVQQMRSIAQSYLEEILSKSPPFGTCPTLTAPNNTRPYYSNMCHYNSLSQAPTDQFGNAISTLTAYTVLVTVDTAAATMGSLSGSTVVARIDVTVSNAPLPPLTLSAYVTNAANS